MEEYENIIHVTEIFADTDLVSQQLTWADFYFAGIIDYLNYLAKQDLTANHENLRQVINNVTSLDGVQNWINQRPATEI